MEPDLLRLGPGRVALLFCRKNSESDCLPMARFPGGGGGEMEQADGLRSGRRDGT
jgi:hypothetical protein